MMTAESMVSAHTLGGLLRDFEGVKVVQDVTAWRKRLPCCRCRSLRCRIWGSGLA